MQLCLAHGLTFHALHCSLSGDDNHLLKCPCPSFYLAFRFAIKTMHLHCQSKPGLEKFVTPERCQANLDQSQRTWHSTATSAVR